MNSIEELQDEVERLKGERDVLKGLLKQCASVLRVIEADDSDEAESLGDLLGGIDRALNFEAVAGSFDDPEDLISFLRQG